MGYQLTAGLTLEPCQPQPPLATFNAFTFRKSVLGLMPSSQAPVSRGFHLHPLERSLLAGECFMARVRRPLQRIAPTERRPE